MHPGKQNWQEYYKILDMNHQRPIQTFGFARWLPTGHEYYEMLFTYVNDILSVSHRSQEAIVEIMTFFKPKDGSIKEPKIYLGGDVAKMHLPNGREIWTTSLRTYIENAIKVIEQLFIEDNEGYSLKNKVKNPFCSGYRPELDV